MKHYNIIIIMPKLYNFHLYFVSGKFQLTAKHISKSINSKFSKYFHLFESVFSNILVSNNVRYCIHFIFQYIVYRSFFIVLFLFFFLRPSFSSGLFHFFSLKSGYLSAVLPHAWLLFNPLKVDIVPTNLHMINVYHLV